MPLQADADFQVLGLGMLIGGQHAADARPVDAQRLLGEDVFARLDGRLEMNRAEAGRRRQDDQVDVRRQELFVRVEAGELMVGLDGDPLRLRAEFVLEVMQAALQLVLEGVGHRHELHVPLRRQGLMGRSGTASAAADQTDANHIAAAGIRPRERITGQQAGAESGSRRRLHEVTARGTFRGRIGHGEDLRGSWGYGETTQWEKHETRMTKEARRLR